MSIRSPEADYRTAIHEAGHVALHVECGLGIEWVTIEPQGDSEGQVLSTSDPVIEDALEPPPDWARDQIRVFLAGPLAEARLLGHREWDFSTSGCQDRNSIIDLALRISGDGEAASVTIASLANEVLDRLAVGPIWLGIEALAVALVRNRCMTGEQAKRVYLRARNAG